MQIIWGPKAPSPQAGLKARYIHFIDSDDSSPEATEKLERLLDYGEAFVGEASNDYVIAIPRIGTISPWSSKATDIAHNAGLSFVKRIERGVLYFSEDGSAINDTVSLYDRMTEQIITSINEAEGLFAAHEPAPLDTIPIMSEGKAAIAKINSERGLVLSEDEIEYLFNRFQELERDPTDVELMMFAQANNDHTRHKIFNAKWIVDGQEQADSLFGMIINTYNQNHEGIKSAYSDNGAVLAGGKAKRFYPDNETHEYIEKVENADIVIKAETHNHPTAISPFPGSGTGSGGEIRDEGATGRGAKPKAGLTGFSVSNLRIPGHERPWEQDYGKPARIVDALSIITEGPLGAAAFNNEFGRTALAGYFRTFELEVNGQVRGYHKPIMLGGGLANIRPKDVIKQTIPVGAKIITLGGPAMLIGLGGGAASTVASGQQSEDLDFASVQRQNPEMQRRAQEVVNACWAAKDNPILSVHDVGAGGWSNALPELVKDAGRGARLELRELPNDEPGMSPMEIWSNEAQERYVLAIEEKDLERFKAICERERCPYAVLGEAVSEKHFQLSDSHFDNNAIDIPMDVVFGKPPKLEMKAAHESPKNLAKLDLSKAKLDEAVELVLRLPAVGSKSFLITIGDRTVGGMNVRDQMVGPWQVPVADSAVTVNDYEGYVGEAMAMGERTPLALINAPASGRMAIGEMITNIASAPIEKLSDVKLSANWMAAAGDNDENLALFETVKTVGMEFCPALGLTIPVGKDSLSMKTIWEENGQQKSVVAPLSLVISGFAPVDDVRRSLTPQLKPDVSGTSLLLIDLSGGNQRLSGSALAYVYGQLGDESPDADAKLLNEFFSSIQSLSRDGKILAYHDRSDGGLFTTLAEMAFAGHCGLDIELPDQDPLPVLFNEELGAVIQVRDEDVALVEKSFSSVIRLGKCGEGNQIKITGQGWSLERSRTELQRAWSETSFLIQSRRDNPKLAQQEYDSLLDEDNPGLNASLSFKPQPTRRSVAIGRPKVAILREQGVNGQVEMAAAFTQVGFQAVDVHMTDLVSGKFKLEEFKGLVTCGGFSYGDVLGAGRGWAQTILFNEELKNQFKDFFERPDSFSLGVCNGCQMLSQLKELIPGAEAWPTFLTNASGRFESRLVMAEITDSPSIFFQGMAGSRLPMPVAHGEGRASFAKAEDLSESISCLRYVDNYGQPAEQYPANPNGSAQGLTGFTSSDGRATIMMPHPERSFRSIQLSWSPDDWPEQSPWLTMFANSFDWQAKL